MAQLETSYTFGRKTIVERIAGEIAIGIFKGGQEPGSTIPTIRELANKYGITIATAQRAIERLKEADLIESRQGSGMRVRNPMLGVGPSAVPYWLEALKEQPEEAARLLAGFLEMRRVMAVELLVKAVSTERDLTTFPSQLVELVEMLGTSGSDHESAYRIDMEISRTILESEGNPAYAMILRMIEKMLKALPLLKRAMYAVPAENAENYRKVFGTLLTRGTDSELRNNLIEIIEKIDNATVDRFKKLLHDETTHNDNS